MYNLDSLMERAMRVLNLLERIRNITTLSSVMMVAFGALFIFGVLNCVLGYRLLRFWMMLFGFAIGFCIGYAGAYSFGIEEQMTRIGIACGAGVVLAILAFLSYKIGIFLLGAGIGLGLGIYLLHPTTSLMFFICILAGILLGVLATRYVREVLIVGTSLMGGAMAGFSLAKLGYLNEIPYGLLFAAAFSVIGMLIQFATNKKYEEEDEEEEEIDEEEMNDSDYVDPREYIPQREHKSHKPHKTNKSRKKEQKESKRQVDFSVGDDEDVDELNDLHVLDDTDYDDFGDLDEVAPETEKTVIYRPQRNSKRSYEIDEEAIEEEIYREMLEEDAQGSEIWNKLGGKINRKKRR